jgi:hypothetical protein
MPTQESLAGAGNLQCCGNLLGFAGKPAAALPSHCARQMQQMRVGLPNRHYALRFRNDSTRRSRRQAPQRMGLSRNGSDGPRRRRGSRSAARTRAARDRGAEKQGRDPGEKCGAGARSPGPRLLGAVGVHGVPSAGEGPPVHRIAPQVPCPRWPAGRIALANSRRGAHDSNAGAGLALRTHRRAVGARGGLDSAGCALRRRRATPKTASRSRSQRQEEAVPRSTRAHPQPGGSPLMARPSHAQAGSVPGGNHGDVRPHHDEGGPAP